MSPPSAYHCWLYQGMLDYTDCVHENNASVRTGFRSEVYNL